MSNINFEDSEDILTAKVERDKQLQKIRVEVFEKFKDYRKTLNFMVEDAPIEILCLPKTIETLLINEGCIRVYDLIDRDFTKIKGFGVARVRDLTARLDEFFTML